MSRMNSIRLFPWKQSEMHFGISCIMYYHMVICTFNWNSASVVPDNVSWDHENVRTDKNANWGNGSTFIKSVSCAVRSLCNANQRLLCSTTPSLRRVKKVELPLRSTSFPARPWVTLPRSNMAATSTFQPYLMRLSQASTVDSISFCLHIQLSEVPSMHLDRTIWSPGHMDENRCGGFMDLIIGFFNKSATALWG